MTLQQPPAGEALFFVQVECTPSATHAEKNDTAGAVANCWIVATNAHEATTIAQQRIRAVGWNCGAPDDVTIVDLDSMDDNQERYQYVEQALIDGEVYAFHCWPVDEQDDDSLR